MATAHKALVPKRIFLICPSQIRFSRWLTLRAMEGRSRNTTDLDSLFNQVMQKCRCVGEYLK
jgi:hypothetical protein